MKKLILITILSLHLFQLSAQINWFEEGAKWKYDFFTMLVLGEISSEYQGDTIVNGLTLNKVKSLYTYRFWQDGQTVPDTLGIYQSLFYQDGNALYQFTQDTLKKLYNFDLSEGDTLDYVIEGFTYGIVDSVRAEQVGNYNLTIQYIDLVLDGLQYPLPTIKMVEGIGHLNTFFIPDFSSYIIADALEYSFRCYTDDSGISIRFNFNGSNILEEEECNDETTTIINDVSFDNLQISPNPTTDIIHVELGTSNITELKLFSITGQLLLMQRVGNELVENLDLSSINKGFYYLVGYNEDGNMMSTNKVIKN